MVDAEEKQVRNPPSFSNFVYGSFFEVNLCFILLPFSLRHQQLLLQEDPRRSLLVISHSRSKDQTCKYLSLWTSSVFCRDLMIVYPPNTVKISLKKLAKLLMLDLLPTRMMAVSEDLAMLSLLLLKMHRR